MRYTSSLLLLICCCTALTTYAQQESIPGTVSFTPEDNGQPARIQSLFRNHDGYLFAGTNTGLFRFNGSNFTPVLFKDSAINNTVTAIFEDKSQQMWVGFANGAIATRTNNRLRLFTPEEGTPAQSITGFTQDGGGHLWFATNGEGIYYRYGTHLYNIDTADGLSDTHVHQLVATPTGEVLAATDQGINICSVNGSAKTIRVLTTANGLPDNLVTCIVPAGNNQYWIGMQDKGYCLYDHRSGTFSRSAANWNYGQINALLFMPSGNLWMATAEKGLLRLATSSASLLPPVVVYEGIRPASGLLIDNEGNFWLHNGDRLLRTNGEKLSLLPVLPAALMPSVHAILIDRQNHCWAGTDMAILRYNLSNADAPPVRYPIPSLTSKTDITSLYEDNRGHIWIGTMGRGVFILNPRNGSCRSLRDDPMLINSSVFSITGRDSTICISGLEGAAVLEAGASSYRCINYTSIPGIGSSIVYSVYKDSRNRTWFATDGKGITVLDKGKYTNYDEHSGLKNNVVYSVTEDRKGHIWFSTAKAGIYRFDGHSFINYAVADGLSSTNISDVKTDGAGNIVIISKKGLDILNPETGRFSYLGRGQGLGVVNTEDIGCVSRDTAGNIYFCTDKGMGRYSPVTGGIAPPRVIIENIRLFLDELGPGPDSLFSHDQNNLSFEFTGLCYSDPERLQYQYRLDGYDTTWISTRDRKAQFARLSPGSYRFRVRASLNNNFTTASEAVFSFVIKKPVWQRWWFILLVITTITALLYWYIKAREKHLRKLQQHEQEKIQFRFQVLRNQVNPHFLFNSFNTLISAIEDDPATAVAYVEQLSAFFRNIVNYRDKDIITLREEMTLLHTYTYLQQKRYGASLQLKVSLTEHELATIMIPPLTLQLLAENAVKHNALSVETPLQIELFIQNNSLIVRNNINPRITRQEGTGMGLTNIISRYHLLTDQQVRISKDEYFFVLSLPVIQQHA